MKTEPEPWLRGPIPGVHPLVMPAFFCFLQVREDLTRHTAGLPESAVWQKLGVSAQAAVSRPPSTTDPSETLFASRVSVVREASGSSLGFHLRHIAGSVDRLTTYLMGNQLTEQQHANLKTEAEPSGTLEELLAEVNRQLARSEERLRSLDPNSFYASRSVGRRALPTSVLGLLVHLCEHTQRHLGQAITLVQWLKEQQ